MVRIDPLTLLMMIAIQAARIVPTGAMVLNLLTVLIMVRLYTAFHPRRLAEAVRSDIARS